VRNASLQSLIDSFVSNTIRHTRFGGLCLLFGDWRFDVWPLNLTWAFREKLLDGGIEDLPRSTFLDVEAVAVELTLKESRRRIYSHGFFEAMERRVVDINLETNPFPDLCVIRALLVADRLNFALGPRIVRYISHYSRQFAPEELLETQRSHYGYAYRDVEELNRCLEVVREHQKHHSSEPFELSKWRSTQLPLWPASYWEFEMA